MNYPEQQLSGAPWRQQGSLAMLRGLRLCRDAWAPGSPWDRHSAHAALWARPAGTFLVVCDSGSLPNLLCLSIGGAGEPIRDFPIQSCGTAVHLPESRLLFPELSQLLGFYSLSRDVLPVCLLIPSWVPSLQDQPEHLLSQLGPKSWLCPSPELVLSSMTGAPESVMCTMQLTTANGALCIINPLYLHGHGDNWSTLSSDGPLLASHPTTFKQERKLTTTRAKGGALLRDGGLSLDQELENKPNSSDADKVQTPVLPTGGSVLRRTSSSCSSTLLLSPACQSPHRVSWLEEDKMWLAPPPPPLDQHTGLELDSLSISSVEEESEPTSSPSQSPHLPRLLLADKVKHRLSAMGQALGGLMSPQRRLTKRVQELSERKGGAFAEAVRGLEEQTVRGGAVYGVTVTEVLQEVRVLLTALREQLLETPEIISVLESVGESADWEQDAMLELALLKVVLKPLYVPLCATLRELRQQDGSLEWLQGNRRNLATHSLEQLGAAATVGPPEAAALERLLQRWGEMHKAYAPPRKLSILLKACKSIYHSMGSSTKPGAVFGADDFLPTLTWVLLRSDVAALQIDTDYMMELLEPSQLQGEGGYYLTSLYAALFYISSFRPRLPVRQLSTEACQSISQWHRRRTLHCNQPRRSQNRRTFRKHLRGEGAGLNLKEMEHRSGRERGNVLEEEESASVPPAGSIDTLQLTEEEEP